MLEIQCRESNESSNIYLWDLGDEHIGVTIWLEQAYSEIFFNFPENPGNLPCAWKWLRGSCLRKFNFPHVKCFLKHWMGCFFYTVVIGSCVVWPEISCSSLSPCKESQTLGICNGKLCNIISAVSEGTTCFQMLYSNAQHWGFQVLSFRVELVFFAFPKIRWWCHIV